MGLKPVAALFVRGDSIYKSMPGVDCWDIERDARNWPGGCAVVAHPPCRAWGSLRHFAKPRHDEKELAPRAVDQVRRWGGVLEHPAASSLFPFMGLPSGNRINAYGGFTMPIWQSWFGHLADKATRLYIVGVVPRDVPSFPLKLGIATHVVSPSHNIRAGDWNYRPQLRKAEREHTPRALADWLVELARRCVVDRESAAA